MADDIPTLRKVCKDDFGIDYGGDKKARFLQTVIISAWELARERVAVQNTQAAHQTLQGLNRQVPKPEHTQVRKTIQLKLTGIGGRIPDSQYPAQAYLEWRYTSIEEGDCEVEWLNKVAAKDEVPNAIPTHGFDPEGLLRMHKMSVIDVPLPSGSEDFRRRMKLMSISYMASQIRYPNISWLEDITKDTMLDHTEFILGEEVAGLRVHGAENQVTYRPDWKTVLLFDFEVRKEAARLVLEDDHKWAQALLAARKDPNLRQKHLMTNMSLDVISRVLTGNLGQYRNQSRQPKNFSQVPGNFPRLPNDEGGGRWGYNQNNNQFSKGNKGGGKGPKGVMQRWGKNGGKGQKGKKGKSSQDRVMKSETPDGRKICFQYNQPSGCTKPNCQFVHLCRICLEEHPCYTHWPSPGKRGGGGSVPTATLESF